MTTSPNPYRGFRFPPEVIEHAANLCALARPTQQERPAMPTDPFVDVGDLPSLGPLRYLDVRDQTAFDAGHTPGAMRVPLEEWDAAAKAADTGFAKTAYWDDQTDRPCHRPEAAPRSRGYRRRQPGRRGKDRPPAIQG